MKKSFLVPFSLAEEQKERAWEASVADSIRNIRGLWLLEGDLGAGKTTLVRAIARARGYLGEVLSPTYQLNESYKAIQIEHFDLYRIEDERELEIFEFDAFDLEQTLVLVEWGKRFESLRRLAQGEISIVIGSEQQRIIHLSAYDD